MKPIVLDLIGVDDHMPILNRDQSKNFDSRFISIKNSYFMNKYQTSHDRKVFLETVSAWNRDGVDGLIFHNFEQHLDRAQLCLDLQIMAEAYNKKIMIVDEPIWSMGRHSEASTNLHEEALRNLKPDLVGYSCLYDGFKSSAKSFYWNNMIDKYVTPVHPGELEKREDIIYGGGKERTYRRMDGAHRCRVESWELCRKIEKRIENLTAELRFTQGRDSRHVYHKYIPEISRGTYHYQPVCGYHFHNLRSLMAWFNGIIPIIHVPNLECPQWKMHVEYFNIEHGQNCILVNDNKSIFEGVVELMKDRKKIDEILENIKCMDLSAYSTTAVSKKIWEVISE